MNRRRRWVVAPIAARTGLDLSGVRLRPTTTADDHLMAELLDRAYVGTIDHDREADHLAELRTWRNVDGADDDASALAVHRGSVIGACLIGRELGAPFLYEIVVVEEHRSRGVARHLLNHAMSVLAARPEPHIAAWVTEGNAASEALLSREGFVPVTPPVDPAQALGYYRAAGAVRTIGVDPEVPLAATLEEGGPTLWVIDDDRPAELVTVRDIEVHIEHLNPESTDIVRLAEQAMPLRHAAWLLAQRAT